MSDVATVPRSWRSFSYRLGMTFFAVAGVVWLGGIVYRALIANELFIPGTLIFDPAILPAQESMLYQLIAASSLVVVISYAVAIISAIVVFRTIPLRTKEHGWLMMAAILLFMFIPVEVFTGYLDIRFILIWESTRDMITAHGLEAFIDVRSELQATVSHRIGALGGLPVMAVFCYVTALVVMIWQPMRTAAATAEPDGEEKV
jgi:amino acid transporter